MDYHFTEKQIEKKRHPTLKTKPWALHKIHPFSL